MAQTLKVIGLLAGMFTLVIIAVATGEIMRKEPSLAGDTTGDRILLNYPMEFNFKQSKNSCGPYSVAAALRVLGDTDVSSEEIANTISWRYPNGPTLPWGVASALHEYGVTAASYDLESFSDEEKLTFLYEQVNAGSPVILLGAFSRDPRTQHYMTVVGYDKAREFYVYDSAYMKNEENEKMTLDANGNPPGNRTLTIKELFEFWSKGGMFDVYNFHAIVAST